MSSKKKVMTVDVRKCLFKNIDPKHWNHDGTCKCVTMKVEHVGNILEGAWSALELLSFEELQYLQQVYATKSMLQQKREDMAKNMMLTVLVRGAAEERALREVTEDHARRKELEKL